MSAVVGLTCVGLLVGTMAAGLVMSLHALQAARHERIRLRECLAERERRVRDLHDTLLQNTQGFILTVQAAATRLPPDDPVRKTLDAALTRVDAVMVESRDRIQGVDPALRDAGPKSARGYS